MKIDSAVAEMVMLLDGEEQKRAIELLAILITPKGKSYSYASTWVKKEILLLHLKRKLVASEYLKMLESDAQEHLNK